MLECHKQFKKYVDENRLDLIEAFEKIGRFPKENFKEEELEKEVYKWLEKQESILGKEIRDRKTSSS